MNVTEAWVAAETGRLRARLEADALAAELGCEVILSPELAGRVEAWNPLPGLYLVIGTPDDVRAEVRKHGQQERPPLTPRERQVVRLVASGLRNREAAVRLGISARTVDEHLRRIYAKLGIGGGAGARVRLVRWAAGAGEFR